LSGGRWRRGAAVALLVAACYANTLANDFVWDDRLTAIVPASPATIVFARTGPYYRPVTMLSFALDRLVWGARPAGFHLTNMVAHGGTAFLVGELATALGHGEGAALAAALVFAAHPVQTDAVSYVSGRTDLLCALFLVAALLVWRRARAVANGAALATGVLVLLALGAKETAIAAPLVLLLPGAHPDERPPRPLVPLGVAALWTVAWLATGPPNVGAAGLVGRLPAMLASALEYVRLVLWPRDLHLERFVAVQGWSAGAVAAMVAATAALATALVWTARRVPGGLLLFAFAAATYLPASGVVPVYPAIADRALFAAEHFLYVPLAGLVPLAVGIVAPHVSARAGAAIVGALLAVWMPRTIVRNREWRDEETLFRQTLRYDPPAARVWYDLGNLRLAAGDPVEAERLYRAAVARAPRDAAAHLNLGIALGRQGRSSEAAAEYEAAIEIDPRLVEAFRRPVSP
jgi:protein O-mannosyl-transferase